MADPTQSFNPTSSIPPGTSGVPLGPGGPGGPGGKGGRFGGNPRPRISNTNHEGTVVVDWKDTETLRRLLSPNGKIQGRRRLSTSAREQRLLSQAIKRARFMALLPYTSATV